MMLVILVEVLLPKPLLLHRVAARVFSRRLAVLLELELLPLSPPVAHHPQESRPPVLLPVSLLHQSSLGVSRSELLWLWL